MRLFEFDQNQNLLVKITALSDQLRNDIQKGIISPKFSTDMLLDYFRKYGVVLDKEDLYNMILKEPLKNIISNIQNDMVQFKGMPQEPKAPEPANPEKSKDIVSKMAHKAAGKKK